MINKQVKYDRLVIVRRFNSECFSFVKLMFLCVSNQRDEPSTGVCGFLNILCFFIFDLDLVDIVLLCK